MASAQKLVCLPSKPGTAAGAQGSTCNLTNSPCAPGLACIDGTCLQYCDGSSYNTCGGSQMCCAVPSNSPVYSVCKTGC